MMGLFEHVDTLEIDGYYWFILFLKMKPLFVGILGTHFQAKLMFCVQQKCFDDA